MSYFATFICPRGKKAKDLLGTELDVANIELYYAKIFKVTASPYLLETLDSVLNPIMFPKGGVLAEIEIMEGAEVKEYYSWSTTTIKKGKIKIIRILDISSPEFILEEIKKVLDLSKRKEELSSEAAFAVIEENHLARKEMELSGDIARAAVDTEQKKGYPWYEHHLFNNIYRVEVVLSLYIKKYGTDRMLDVFSKEEIKHLIIESRVDYEVKRIFYRLLQKDEEDYRFFLVFSHDEEILPNALWHLNYGHIKVAEKERQKRLDREQVWKENELWIVWLKKTLSYIGL